MNTSPFVGWVLNRAQSFPISLKKSTYLNSDAELLIYPKFTSMLLFISITLKRYYQVTLFCIIRVTSRNTISVDVPSPPFHLGGRGEGGGYGCTWAGTDCRVQRSLLFLNTSRYRTCKLRKKSTTPFQSFTIRLLEVSVNSNLFHLYFTSINIYPDDSNFTEVTN